MKRLIKKLAIIGVFSSSLLFADMVVPPTQLPQNAQTFISTNFPGVNIAYVEADYDDFEVRLANGVKIDFWRDGNWKEISNYAGIEPKILPSNVAATIAKTYPNVAIVKIEKEWNGYEVKLVNNMKVFLDNNGNLLGQKFDD